VCRTDPQVEGLTRAVRASLDALLSQATEPDLPHDDLSPEMTVLVGRRFRRSSSDCCSAPQSRSSALNLPRDESSYQAARLGLGSWVLFCPKVGLTAIAFLSTLLGVINDPRDKMRTKCPVGQPRKRARFRTADQLVLDGTFPISAEKIRQIARQRGIGKKAGRTYIFSDRDVQKIYEVLPCPSNSSSAPNHQTGSFAAPSGEYALKKVQELLISERPRRSGRSAKRRY